MTFRRSSLLGLRKFSKHFEKKYAFFQFIVLVSWIGTLNHALPLSSPGDLQGESPCSSKIGQPQGVYHSPSSTGVLGMDLDINYLCNGQLHVQFQVKVTRGVYFSFCGGDHQRKNLLSGVICGRINYASGRILR